MEREGKHGTVRTIVLLYYREEIFSPREVDVPTGQLGKTGCDDE